MSDYDAEMIVREPDRVRGPTKLIVWRWADGRPTVTPTEHQEMKRLITEAEQRFDMDDLASDDVVARIWMTDDERVDEVEWRDDIDDEGSQPRNSA